MSFLSTYGVKITIEEDLQKDLESRIEEFGSLDEYVSRLIETDLRSTAMVDRTYIENILSDRMVEMMRDIAPTLSSLLMDDIILEFSVHQEGESRLMMGIPDFDEIEPVYRDRYEKLIQQLKDA